MQPEIVWLYLLAMLMFTSSGCALPHNFSRRDISRSPFKASILNSEGRRVPHNSPDNKGPPLSATQLVGNALRTMQEQKLDEVNLNRGLLSLMINHVRWERGYALNVVVKPVVYFVIENPNLLCDPYCLGFVVGSQRVRSMVMLAHGELHYPDSAEVLGMLDFNEGRKYVGGLEIEEQKKLKGFVKFVEGIKETVKKAKVKHPDRPVAWPVLQPVTAPDTLVAVHVTAPATPVAAPATPVAASVTPGN
ncbi:hypothetical protein BDP27DRAFT_323062 [Rhodocollybia butyracea]|uniref:Uncharacterized protein n=1 Tax=Rhodocollybia butyracea TaxID=206335 RepID=A0A9P5PB42_9AGAR|nr:hypothetical protein BDP27DRAFT_323062 [Rhodocollybia butyracea]